MDRLQLLLYIGFLVPSLFVDYLSTSFGLYFTVKVMMSDDSQLSEPASKKQRLNIEDSTNKSSTITDNHTDVYENESYNSFVTQEEFEKLKEFKVLDEVKSNDEDSNNEDSDSDGESEGLPEEEIEKMLEEDLPEGFKGVPKPKEKPYVTKKKIVLEEKGVNHFEVLPLDWIAVRHFSGIPIYMHRASRVCTLSKPYFLGKGNTRRHEIPISAIPCLAYRRALEEEEKQTEMDRKMDEQIKSGNWQQNTESKTNDEEQNKTANTKTATVIENIESTNTHKLTDTDIIENHKQTTLKIIDIKKNCGITQNTIESNTGSNQTDNKRSPSDNTITKCPFMNGTIMSKQDVVETEEKIAVDTDKMEGIESKDEEIKVAGDKEKIEEVPLSRQPVVLPGGIVMPPPRVETVNTSWKTQHLTAEQVNDYCKTLFKFKTINIMHFMCWADRRKYTKARKTLQYPALPPGTKFVTIPAQANTSGQDNGGKQVKRDWVMNMNGRSYLSEFHEYVRRALQKQPVYEFKQLENAHTPYQATVYIGGMQYGVGHGTSKRQAKSAAARASIQILIPEMRDEHPQPDVTQANEPDFSFFDYVGIEDPRITEFCAATCEPSPHAILRTCLLRNFGAGERHIHTEMKKEFQKIELTMKVGKHSATVVCKNKKTAKQRASQTILQALHPQLRSWGSLLRLYGSRSIKSGKEKKLEEQQITLLQDKARPYEPNYAVLEKLRNEMKKLKERDAAVVPIGTLLVHDELPTHSGSNLNNVEL